MIPQRCTICGSALIRDGLRLLCLLGSHVVRDIVTSSDEHDTILEIRQHGLTQTPPAETTVNVQTWRERIVAPLLAKTPPPPPKRRVRQPKRLCGRGHDDWRERPDGTRECRTCDIARMQAKRARDRQMAAGGAR